MNRILAVPLLLLATAGSALADSRTVTFYSDGALVEIEATATGGVLEFPLPGALIENSLRIKPLTKSVIQRVEILPARPNNRIDQKRELLLGRKNLLEDRLQSLASREEIFLSAAKSQSGKAPRRTKSNPDPIQAIRAGTEFALAQLEGVHSERRKISQEVNRINSRIADLRKGEAGAGKSARVRVSPQNGRVRIRYAIEGPGWVPCYDIRLRGDGSAGLTLYGQLPAPFKGYRLQAAATALSDSAGAGTFPVAGGSLARLAEFNLTMDDERYGGGVRCSFSALATNRSVVYLPAGEASLYRNGEYLGKMRFDGLSSGRSRRISTGF